MVFCGRPSKGCGQCRSRKIRCDQARPACSQCLKGNRVCPGYRDELSLMFRDESHKVVRKAKNGTTARKSKPVRKADRSRTVSTDGSSPELKSEISVASTSSDIIELNDDDDNNDDGVDDDGLQAKYIDQQRLTQLRPSYQSTQEEAVCFFLRYNPWPGANSVMNLNEDFFRETKMSSSKQALKASMVSVGTAMLARIRQSISMQIAAVTEYGSALQLLAFAVMDQNEVKANQTLAAALFLAIFEVVTSRALPGIEKWTNHIRGATALIELRGPDQLRNEDGLKLFIHLRFQIIISCVQQGIQVPPSILEGTQIAMFLRPQTEAHADRLISILGRLANLRADVRMKRMTDNQKILSTAYSIEADLVAWLAALPPEFMYITVDNPYSDPDFKNLTREVLPYDHWYHIYPEFWICHTWNQYRCARLIVCEIILSCLQRLSINSAAAWIPSELQSHCFRIRSTARQIAADICASVPYHFGIGPSHIQEQNVLPVNQSFTAGLMLLWPLVLAGATEGKNHPIRKWAIGCLTVVGRSMGIDQALALIEVLETEASIYEGVDDDGVIIQEKNLAATRNKVLKRTLEV